jgi:hypothetical protein
MEQQYAGGVKMSRARRRPPLAMGQWHYRLLLLHLSNLLLAGLFASTRLCSHAECRRRCGSTCILGYLSRDRHSIPST